jgi:hypothetical protein
MIKNILNRNKILFWLGTIHLIFFLLLAIYFPFNKTIVLGINSLIKPMKFALSIWIYSWTMALILHYFNDVKKVKIYSWVAVISMSFEQIAITYQALKGELSHFNSSNSFGIILFSLMGVFILTITLWTAYMTYIFIRQKTYNLNEISVLAIKIGLVYFVIFSLFGGYISSLKGHTIGGTDDGKGLFFINWNTSFGDLRVAHFFGIHSLQIMPLFAILMHKFSSNKRVLLNAIYLFSIIYLAFILFTLIQGLKGVPFIYFK